MKKTKQLLSLFLVFCMVIAMVPKIISAQEGSKLTVGNGGMYATVSAALVSAVDGDTITLLNDITETVDYRVTKDKTLTIDGQNHKITGIDNVTTNASSSGIILDGEGTIKLKNITFVGGGDPLNCLNTASYGMMVMNATIFVKSEGVVNCIGGISDSSYGVYNNSLSTINLTSAFGADQTSGFNYGVYNNAGGTINVYTAKGCDNPSNNTFSIGVVNNAAGTVNVKDANGSYYGVANYGEGIVNVANTTSNFAAAAYNHATGTINATYAKGTTKGVTNDATGKVNAGTIVGNISGTVNGNVAALTLKKGSGSNCVLDTITVAKIGVTEIGKLPSVYCKGIYSNSWYVNSEKSTALNGSTVSGETTLYSIFFYTVSGKITGNDTNLGLAAMLQLKDSNGENVGDPVTASPDGTYNIEASRGSNYTIEVTMNGYEKGIIASFDLVGSHATGKDFVLAKIVPPITVTKISLSATALAIPKGNEGTVGIITIIPANAANQKMKWSSSDASIASVNKEGKIKAVKAGVATITCTAEDGSAISASCKVMVSESTKTSIKVAWRKAENIDGYQLKIYKGTKKIATKYMTNTSQTFKKLAVGTTYKIEVKTYTQEGNERIVGNPILTLQAATKPATPMLRVKAGSKKAYLSWKKVNGTSGYQIQMSLKKTSGYALVKTITKGKTDQYTKKELEKGKRYYFKIRAYKLVEGQKVYSSFSATKLIAIK